jgi:ergothioneine biosynthesis protein EgtB
MDQVVEATREDGNDRAFAPLRADDEADLLARFLDVRATTDELTRTLAPEDFVVQSMEDVSPTKWHLAHTSWFWEAFVLSEHLEDYRPFHPRYHYLFNSYYVQAGERHCRAQRGYLSRPTVAEVREYRRHVNEAMANLLARDSDAGRSRELTGLVELGMNHEQQHQELILTDLKHVFSVNPLRPSYTEPGARPEGEHPRAEVGGTPWTPPPADPVRWIPFDGGLHEIGYAGTGFHFDNEAPRHRRFIEPFALADRPATNAEYLAFMEDGGYQRAALWMSEGWAKREAEGWTEPFYWERRDGEWWTFTLEGMRPVNLLEPVCHLTWFEADAFARWSGARLPREDEWEVAAATVPPRGNLADSGLYHPVAAAHGEVGRESPEGTAGARAGGLRQMFGDVWEWTESSYSPYPGFRPAEGAIGEYNGKFMCGQFVLRGGSCVTPGSHIRATYRNFFHPDTAWQFSGVRLARDAR